MPFQGSELNRLRQLRADYSRKTRWVRQSDVSLIGVAHFDRRSVEESVVRVLAKRPLPRWEKTTAC